MISLFFLFPTLNQDDEKHKVNTDSDVVPNAKKRRVRASSFSKSPAPTRKRVSQHKRDQVEAEAQMDLVFKETKQKIQDQQSEKKQQKRSEKKQQLSRYVTRT